MSRKDTQPIKQAGEYLVAAELARLGLICATFSGNVRHYDIVASGPAGGHIAVQVKAKASGSWQLKLDAFADVRMEGDRQVLEHPRLEPLKGLVVVFVALGKEYGSDEFFVVPWRDLQEIVIAGYRDYLARHGGRRPRSPRSLHTAVQVNQLSAYRANWDPIRRLMGSPTAR
jgi:hypothetical protein